MNSESCRVLPHDCKTLKKPLGSFRALLGQRRNKISKELGQPFSQYLKSCASFLSGNTCWVCGNRLVQKFLPNVIGTLQYWENQCKFAATKQSVDSSKHMDSFRKQSWEIWHYHMHPSALLWKFISLKLLYRVKLRSLNEAQQRGRHSMQSQSFPG